jgi:putative DNA primase/helicase
MADDIELSDDDDDLPETSGSQGRILDPSDPIKSARSMVASILTDAQNLRKLHHYRGDFYWFNGTHYQAVDNGEIRKIVWEFLESAKRIVWVLEGDGEDAEKVSKIKPFKPNMNAVSNVVDALAAVTEVEGSPELPAWLGGCNSPPSESPPSEILSLSNGLLHVPTKRLHPSTPAFFSTTASEVAFDLYAPEPTRWMQFLDEVFGEDQEAKSTLQEWLGYLLTPNTSLQKIMLMVGPARGGKGTIGRIIRELLGPRSVAPLTLADLGKDFGLQHLIGKTACVISDARFSTRADPAVVAERLLSISGEDALPIGRKFKSVWEGALKVRFTVMTNELPQLTDNSGALMRRFVVLKLRHSFLGREDPGLFEKLQAELPGILNWAIAGHARLKSRGRFEMPTSSADAIQAMSEIGSPILSFIADYCDVGPGFEVEKKALFEKWYGWCNRTGNRSGTESMFGRDLRAAVAGIGEKRPRSGNRERVYTGIQLIGGASPKDETVVSFEMRRKEPA